MPVNDKQATLEPVQYDDKNTLATVFLFLSVIIWCLGTVLTVFAILAKVGVGSFADMFVSVLPDGVKIYHIVSLALSVLFSGLTLMTISEILRLLQRKATTIYTIRGLDQAIPRNVELSGFDPAAFTAARENASEVEENSPEDNSRSRQLDASGIQITINVNPPAGDTRPVPVTVSADSGRQDPAKTAETVSAKTEIVPDEPLPAESSAETNIVPDEPLPAESSAEIEMVANEALPAESTEDSLPSEIPSPDSEIS